MLTPDEYHGGNLGASGYGASAIGSNQSVSSNGGGVLANPNNYGGGCSAMSGGSKRRTKQYRKRYGVGMSRKRCKSGRRGRRGRSSRCQNKRTRKY